LKEKVAAKTAIAPDAAGIFEQEGIASVAAGSSSTTNATGWVRASVAACAGGGGGSRVTAIAAISAAQ
jgi:hypothetical protein